MNQNVTSDEKTSHTNLVRWKKGNAIPCWQMFQKYYTEIPKNYNAMAE